jgi:hypothetical protein
MANTRTQTSSFLAWQFAHAAVALGSGETASVFLASLLGVSFCIIYW